MKRERASERADGEIYTRSEARCEERKGEEMRRALAVVAEDGLGESLSDAPGEATGGGPAQRWGA